VSEDHCKIVVTHHPFICPPNIYRPTVGSAAAALKKFDECGVDILLSGHYHRGHIGEADAHFPDVRRPILLVHAGTTISTRLKQEVNSYNFLTIKKNEITIDVRGWNGKAFSHVRTYEYGRKGESLTMKGGVA
jgi:predicted phosphodiesterase